MDKAIIPRDLDLARRGMGGLATDDAEHAAARWAGTQGGVFYNTGHGHLGWTLSAATAGMVADAVDFSVRAVRPRLGLMLRSAET